MYGRMLSRQWRNGPGGRWTHRIRWYEGTDIRLEIETPDGVWNIFPLTKDHAEELWAEFKKEHSREGT